MPTKTLMNLIPTIQSASLVSHNLKVVNKKKKTTKDMIGLGMTNIIGTSLIKAEANLIGEL